MTESHRPRCCSGNAQVFPPVERVVARTADQLPLQFLYGRFLQRRAVDHVDCHAHSSLTLSPASPLPSGPFHDIDQFLPRIDESAHQALHYKLPQTNAHTRKWCNGIFNRSEEIDLRIASSLGGSSSILHSCPRPLLSQFSFSFSRRASFLPSGNGGSNSVFEVGTAR